jgi:hypothetical protein
MRECDIRIGGEHSSKAVRPDLKNFYASLSDAQKARLNIMGPPPPPTARCSETAKTTIERCSPSIDRLRHVSIVP